MAWFCFFQKVGKGNLEDCYSQGCAGLWLQGLPSKYPLVYLQDKRDKFLYSERPLNSNLCDEHGLQAPELEGPDPDLTVPGYKDHLNEAMVQIIFPSNT